MYYPDNFNEKVYSLLKGLYGEDADFRDGQYEAIEATLKHHRTLVVQQTGWGKSLVYFLSTHLTREQGAGATLVISPLLVLMDNQKLAAERLGLECKFYNSKLDKEEKIAVLEAWEQNKLDVLLITPEALLSDDVRKKYIATGKVQIGMFVIDEAHCISDWGHDFRLEYGKVASVLGENFLDVPVLATTATANDRVIADIEEQMGKQVKVIRGPLTRETLAIQVGSLQDEAYRYAWILDAIPKLQGSGIVYCIAKKDCDRLAFFLKKQQIEASAYHADMDAENCAVVEDKFMKNEIKVLVATTKLGMGYDKGDISFVIHYQRPANMINYYQQIGRAGRDIPEARVVLLTGPEDKDILSYFRDSAFPTEEEFETIYQYIVEHTTEGSSKNELLQDLNFSGDRIDKTLLFLLKNDFIEKAVKSFVDPLDGKTKKKTCYVVTAKPYHYDGERYAGITKARLDEEEAMDKLLELDKSECLSMFVAGQLDDHLAKPCGKCQNCDPDHALSWDVSDDSLKKAQEFLRTTTVPLEPRKQIYVDGSPNLKTLAPALRNEIGLCLCKYGQYGNGRYVKEDKYSPMQVFRDELVEAAREACVDNFPLEEIDAITFVPSRRSQIVPNFAKRLGTALGLPVVELLEKSESDPQKKQENSYHQFKNADRSFSLIEGVEIPKRLILVDDISDSKWTLTVCGKLLRENDGASAVYPMILASSAPNGG